MNMRYDIQYHAIEQERKRLPKIEKRIFEGRLASVLRKLIFKPEFSRDVDKKNIERLKRIFARQGCLRLSPSNHVPANYLTLVTADCARHLRKRLETSQINRPIYTCKTSCLIGGVRVYSSKSMVAVALQKRLEATN
jgi:hypothetical protein